VTEWNLRINTTRECRVAFETWARANGFEVVTMKSMDAYYSGATDQAWNTWQEMWTNGRRDMSASKCRRCENRILPRDEDAGTYKERYCSKYCASKDEPNE
jgi:hypothetical protein